MAASNECVVVIDGVNVACQKDGKPHMPHLAAAIEYFQSLEPVAGRYPIKCVAFVPNFWLNVKPAPGGSAGPRENGAMETDDWTLLNELVQTGCVILTPSQAHDDLYVIDYAVKYNGFIVTNDMFRDHVSNKRAFHGNVLTSHWVQSHCIDFTFVGKEFMPNPRAMERVSSFQPPALVSLSFESSSLNDINRRNSETDVHEDGMIIDHAGQKRVKNIDLSEVTYYKVPRELLPMLHGKGGETMEKFQEYTGTYIVLPSHAVLDSPSTKVKSSVLTLSIYGVNRREASRQQAVKHLDAFLFEMQQKTLWAVHQQQQQDYGGGTNNCTQDDQMMEIDPS